MIGHQFRTNKDFFYNVKSQNNTIIGRSKIKEDTIVTVLDTEIRKGVGWSKLSHNIGWISTKNRIWKYLDLFKIHVSAETDDNIGIENHMEQTMFYPGGDPDWYDNIQNRLDLSENDLKKIVKDNKLM